MVPEHAETQMNNSWRKGSKKKRSIKPKENSSLTLIPHTYPDGVIEYKVHKIGFSQRFSKVRAVFTSEMIDKGESAMKF